MSLWFACLAACKPEPAAVAPQPVATPAPPPRPAQCAALSENCSATDSTVLGIGDHGSSITPPAGWTFAKQSDRSVAVGPDGKALIAAVEIASSTEADVLEALEKLTTASAIEKVKFDALKRRFKEPQLTVNASGIPVDLWEVSKATALVNPELLGKGSGTLLIFVARLAVDRAVTGLGFVVVPDAEAEAEKVMNAVQSLKVNP
ncbi:MAG: hypothetical protein ABJB12_18800 [Pseudomonadota bacterium]